MKSITDNAAQILYDGPPRLTGFGLPLPQGALRNTQQLQLTQGDQALESHVQARATWPDGSIRWCWIQAIVSQSGLLGLQLAPETETAEEKNDDTPASVAALNSSESPTLPTSEQSRISGQTLLCFIPLQGLTQADLSGAPTEAAAKISVQVQVTLKGHTQPMAVTQLRAQHKTTPLSESVILSGILARDKSRLNLVATIEQCRQTQNFTCTIRLHNPQAAKHNTGSWDLGDPGSCQIDKFALVWSLPNTEPGLFLQTQDETPDHAETTGNLEPSQASYHLGGNFTLTQHGSGGPQWQSPIHWDAQRRNPIKARGFTLQYHHTKGDSVEDEATAHEKSPPTEGLRAQPTGILKLPQTREAPPTELHISLEDFWQNFPAQLEGTQGGLRFELFPTTTELQGGESKTWTLCGQLQSAPAEADTPPSAPPKIRYSHAYLNSSGVFPHLRFSQTPNAISELIFRGLTGKTNFFAKREAADVYGWRHYGELYADHEAVNCPPGEYFISHYNNQYDPLMGMTLQYLHWGELSWLDLIQPLAQHTKDIDIYDTTQDKAEYNGGLFWHTDHYLPAETSSHRSYSRYHTAVYDGHAGGGGPGGQHCYTTGLALQYWLFGDEQAKEKVLQLTRWIRAFYNGNGGLLDRLFRLLTIDFKQKQFTNIGLKAPGFRYPLDRGTGNYLIALIDAYDLTEKDNYLTEMAFVIRHTVHPEDSLTERDLLDVENAWFYTVFLQALVRYLCLKETLIQIDDDYWYARHSFMAYLAWMREHERFYLDHPEQLEFPNDTWCAQEMRKANLFCYGWYFAREAEPDYLTRAEAFYQYIEQRLSKSPEAEYTRILALLMQNDGIRQKFRSRPRSAVAWCDKKYGPHPSHDPKLILATFFKDMFKLVGHFSPNRELQWIKHRFPKLFR